jgi:hypothetical protein
MEESMRDYFKFARVENIRQLTEQLHSESDPARRARLEGILEDIRAGTYEPPSDVPAKLIDPGQPSDR